MFNTIGLFVAIIIFCTSNVSSKTIPLKMKAPIVADVDMSSVKSYIDEKINTEIPGIVQKEVKTRIEEETKILKEHLSSEIQATVGQEVEKAVKANIDKLSRKLNREMDFNIERQVQKVVSSEMKTILEKIENSKAPKFKPRDCLDISKRGSRSGIYTIYPDDSDEFKVYCDMETDGGGWTVFQLRNKGNIHFYRNWDEYEKGFGNLKTEFWLGNSKLHALTSQGKYEMRIDLEDFKGNTAYARYAKFAVGDSSSYYKLSIGDYSGTAGDSLAYHNGQAFTTKDKDNDYNEGNCAKMREGAWWYKSCYHSNLNGRYGNNSDASGMRWFAWQRRISMKTTKMMIRRKF